ncbi:MAG TPA: alpha/beta fold hydrolase, partial [Verrucomicrobiae bacterium]|nr:alpha/beta fold hydrolase [Verrucomicrobiae bacterium]
MNRRCLLALLATAFTIASPAGAAEPDRHQKEGDFILRDFHFASGETLAELKIHYLTLGEPVKDKQGHVTNAVLILHGTGGSGRQFLRPQFADVLFASGGLLDPAKYFIILPDGIGHGGSSKPSDGLHARFPRYTYADMIEAQHHLAAEHLSAPRLRLVMGTSMGCMHAFMWGETFPDAMEALMPLACLPVPIAGRNRLWRKMTMDAIRED